MRAERVAAGGGLAALAIAGWLAAPATDAAPDASGAAQFTGAGSCASSACHGSRQPRAELRIAQDEYTRWAGSADRHSRAYRTLGGDLSARIQRNLGRQEPAAANARCLGCHALDVPEARRAHTFDLADGVSCEACHGPAERWLGPHTLTDWTRAQSVAAGMRDLAGPLARARACASCHVGEAGRHVDHELLAAGHPDLVFELDTYCEVMPAHWRERETDPWRALRQWAVGQTVALGAALDLLATRAPAAGWPEFADLECFACHHGLVAARDSRRVQQGPAGRLAGRPAWSRARLVALAPLLAALDPAAHAAIARDVEALERALASGEPGAAAAAQRVAAALAPLATRLADRATTFDRGLAGRWLALVERDADAIAATGYRGAEQAALALDVARRPLLGAEDGGGRALLDPLFASLADPNRYDPAAFAGALRGAAGRLRATAAAN